MKELRTIYWKIAIFDVVESGRILLAKFEYLLSKLVPAKAENDAKVMSELRDEKDWRVANALHLTRLNPLSAL